MYQTIDRIFFFVVRYIYSDMICVAYTSRGSCLIYYKDLLNLIFIITSSLQRWSGHN